LLYYEKKLNLKLFVKPNINIPISKMSIMPVPSSVVPSSVLPLKETYLDFHSGTVPEDLLVLMAENEKFGVLTIKAASAPVTRNPVFILFTVDRTDSMSETDLHGNSKMHYVKETFKKMIDFISKKDAPVYVRIHAFNISVEVVVDTILVTPYNAADIINKITSVRTADCTAIDCAMQAANEAMLDYMSQNPSHSVHHIFMTDGEATAGVQTHSLLAEMVIESFPNTFIGFGGNHNAELLRRMSDRDLANYDIVDNNENTGLVYGDIIHGLLYPAAKNITMHADNALLYDWKTNRWVADLSEPILVGESTRTYHVKTSTPADATIEIRGQTDGSDEIQLFDTAFVMPDLESMETGEIISSTVDLTRFVFRQAVQQIMFEARCLDTTRRSLVSQFKDTLATMFRKLRVYIRKSDLIGDPMLTQLCDDLYITHRTLGTRNGKMFTLARQSTQGRQRSHMPSPFSRGGTQNLLTPLQHPGDYDETDDDFSQFVPRAPRAAVRRQDALNHVFDTQPIEFPEIDTNFEDQGMTQVEDEDAIESYKTSDTAISCYASPSALNTMSQLTQTI
jgi:hypothetical protein